MTKKTFSVLVLILIIVLFIVLFSRVQKSECESIKDSKKRDICWAQISKLRNDTYGCEKITDQYIKYDCYTVLVYYNNKREQDICHKLSDNYRANCLIMVAVSKNNIGFCKDLPAIESDDCYNAFAITYKDWLLCDKIVSPYSRDDCYGVIVYFTKSGLQCDRITDNFKRDNCYSKAAVETNDTNFCEKVKGPEIEKDNCYYQIALKKNDRLICGMIESQSSREACYSEII